MSEKYVIHGIKEATAITKIYDDMKKYPQDPSTIPDNLKKRLVDISPPNAILVRHAIDTYERDTSGRPIRKKINLFHRYKEKIENSYKTIHGEKRHVDSTQVVGLDQAMLVDNEQRDGETSQVIDESKICRDSC